MMRSMFKRIVPFLLSLLLPLSQLPPLSLLLPLSQSARLPVFLLLIRS